MHQLSWNILTTKLENCAFGGVKTIVSAAYSVREWVNAFQSIDTNSQKLIHMNCFANIVTFSHLTRGHMTRVLNLRIIIRQASSSVTYLLLYEMDTEMKFKNFWIWNKSNVVLGTRSEHSRLGWLCYYLVKYVSIPSIRYISTSNAQFTQFWRFEQKLPLSLVTTNWMVSSSRVPSTCVWCWLSLTCVTQIEIAFTYRMYQIYYKWQSPTLGVSYYNLRNEYWDDI